MVQLEPILFLHNHLSQYAGGKYLGLHWVRTQPVIKNGSVLSTLPTPLKSGEIFKKFIEIKT